MMFFNKNKFSDLQFPTCININEKEYNIEVEFFKKRSSSVSIKDNIISFRLSSYLSKKDAQEHFASLLKRIYKQAQKKEILNKKSSYINCKKAFEDRGFIFAQTLYKIELVKTRGVKLRDNVFYVNFDMEVDLLEKYIIKFLIKEYTSRIIEYVRELNKQTYNYSYNNDVVLKYVKSKWGHCTETNDLMFNLKLLNAPIELFNYVVIHELAHIKVKNHSATFWREVSRFCPNYKVLRKELRLDPPQLFK